MTGSGHSEDSSTAHAGDVPKGSSKYDNKIGGFGSVTITQDNMHVDLVDKHANVAYSFDRPNSRANMIKKKHVHKHKTKVLHSQHK